MKLNIDIPDWVTHFEISKRPEEPSRVIVRAEKWLNNAHWNAPQRCKVEREILLHDYRNNLKFEIEVLFIRLKEYEP